MEFRCERCGNFIHDYPCITCEINLKVHELKAQQKQHELDRIEERVFKAVSEQIVSFRKDMVPFLQAVLDGDPDAIEEAKKFIKENK